MAGEQSQDTAKATTTLRESYLAFPIKIKLKPGETEARFVIQDPWGLRRSVTPLFLVWGATPEIAGLGTSFFIDASGAQLTAMHLLTDVVNGRIGGHERIRSRTAHERCSAGHFARSGIGVRTTSGWHISRCPDDGDVPKAEVGRPAPLHTLRSRTASGRDRTRSRVSSRDQLDAREAD